MGLQVHIKTSASFQNKMQQLKELNNKTVKAGFFEENIAKIARYNNYGAIIPVTAKMRSFFRYKFNVYLSKNKTHIVLPPRAFMNLAFDNGKKFYAQRLEKAFKITNSPLQSLELLGESMTQDIQIALNPNNWASNAPLTIALKGKNTPLYWTGKMQKSVEYEVS